MFEQLVERLRRTPQWAIAGLVALHVVAWGLVPALTQPNLPLDVIEQLTWGREWQWTYYKHPPLPAWVVEIAANVTQGSERAQFFVGPLATGIALLLIWRLAVDVVGPRIALLVILIQEAVLYFTFFSPEFNHNVIQLPLWALIAWTFHRAVAGDRAIDWLLTGLASGLGMLGKYSTGLLLVIVALFLLTTPTGRQRLRSPGPWIAVAVLLVVLAPHIHALLAIDFGPLRFPFQRAESSRHWFDHIVYPLAFAGAQLAAIAPALVLLIVLAVARQPTGDERPPVAPLDKRYVAFLCWGPFLLSLLLSAILGMKFKDMWGTPFWNYVGLFGLVFLPRRSTTLSSPLLASWSAIFVLGLAGYAAQFPGQALGKHRPLRGQFPGRDLSRAIDDRWRSLEGPRPLRFVIGGEWLAGNVAFPLWPARPSVMIDGEWGKSPWIDPADLACAGAVLVWQGDAGKAMLARFPTAQPQPEIILPYRTWKTEPPARIDWAVLAPASTCALSDAKS